MRNRLAASLFTPRFTLARASRPNLSWSSARPIHATTTSTNSASSSTPISPIETIRIPAIPSQINIDHIFNLNSNNVPMLMTEQQINQIKLALDGKPDGKYSKKRELADLGINSRFSIIKVNEKHYALYQGEKSGKLCGAGTLGKVKFAQDLDTGEWIAVKIQTAATIAKQSRSYESTIKFLQKTTADEVEILKNMNGFYGSFERNSPSKGFQTYILMNLVKGKTINNYLAYMSSHNRTMSLHHAVNIGINIFDTLDRLHNQYRITHNDLHSGNVMFYPPREQIKVIDFGYSIDLNKIERESSIYISRDIASACYMMESIWKILPQQMIESYPEEYKVAQSTIQFLGEKKRESISNPEAKIAADTIKNYLKDVKNSLPHHEFELSDFDIDMMRHKNSDEKYKYYAEKRKFDRTTLVNTNPHPFQLFDLILIKRELESRGILASDSVVVRHKNNLFSHTSPQPNQQIESHAADKMSSSPEFKK